jgi:8-oxo-dGTP pyrophosphatase MutT (NUDIX family)
MQPPPPADRVVVGAAIVSYGRVLAARRTGPARLAGGWELPGGKLEPGETLVGACAREVREELCCGVRVLDEVGAPQPLSEGYVLRVFLAELVEGEPIPMEHDAVRWLAPDELDDVPWLAPDLPYLPVIRARLLRPVQAAFADRGDAEAALAELGEPAARLLRDRFAGEDDDEDVAWLVEAPAAARGRLGELADRHAGELVAEQHTAPVAPAPLPAAPKRIKRPS